MITSQKNKKHNNQNSTHLLQNSKNKLQELATINSTNYLTSHHKAHNNIASSHIFKTKLFPIITVLASPFVILSSAVASVEVETVIDNDLPSAELFLECSQLTTGAGRLACYDKVAAGGKNTVGREKQPLDIAETVKSTILDRNPQVVLADQPVDEASVEIEDAEILTTVGVTRDELYQYSPLSRAYDLDKNSEVGVWRVRPHKSIYLMPFYSKFDPNRSPESPTQLVKEYSLHEYEPLELKSQISLKTKVMEDVFASKADIWFGYTQKMYWQVYNDEYSRPFRATDYMPEIFITQPVKADLPFDGNLRMLGAGVIHHSNGQSDPLSRSWNRVYLMAGAEWKKLTIEPKIWAHVKNSSDSDPSDNPDITDYYGYGELRSHYDFGKGKTLGLIGRYNFDEKKGAVELEYIYPLTDEIKGYMQVFHGYGDSIIDYNDETTGVGVGLTLNAWEGF